MVWEALGSPGGALPLGLVASEAILQQACEMCTVLVLTDLEAEAGRGQWSLFKGHTNHGEEVYQECEFRRKSQSRCYRPYSIPLVSYHSLSLWGSRSPLPRDFYPTGKECHSQVKILKPSKPKRKVMCESHSCWEEENEERELEGAASEICLERGWHLCGWRSEECLGKDWGGGGGRPFRMTGATVRWAVVGPRLAWGDWSACGLPGNSEGWAGQVQVGATLQEGHRDKHGWNRLKGKCTGSRISPTSTMVQTEPGGRSWENRVARQAEKCPAERIIFVYGACNQLWGVPVKQGYRASMRSCYPVTASKGLLVFGPQMADISVLGFTIFLGILKFLEFLKDFKSFSNNF